MKAPEVEADPACRGCCVRLGQGRGRVGERAEHSQNTRGGEDDFVSPNVPHRLACSVKTRSCSAEAPTIGSMQTVRQAGRCSLASCHTISPIIGPNADHFSTMRLVTTANAIAIVKPPSAQVRYSRRVF